VGIVSADFLGFPSTLGNQVRRRCEGNTGAEHPDRRHATRTARRTAMASRTSPATRRADEKYVELVCAQMAEALHEAVANLQPVRLKIATGEAKGKYCLQLLRGSVIRSAL